MRVTFLGTGAAMPSGRRSQTGLLIESAAQRAAESESGRTAREQDDDHLLVDCGSGVLNALARTDAGYEAVSTVLLTHHHLDHVADLLPLMKARWIAGEDHLEIVGPQGTKELLDGLLDVHEYMDGRIDLRVREIAEESFSLAGFDIEAKETRHSMYCLAYRFSHGANTPVFTFSADSEAFEGLANFADGSAVLAHDCSFPDDVDVSNHPTPSQLGETLADSGTELGRVYLTHLYPHTEGRHEEMLESVGEYYDGDVRFARDGLTVEIE